MSMNIVFKTTYWLDLAPPVMELVPLSGRRKIVTGKESWGPFETLDQAIEHARFKSETLRGTFSIRLVHQKVSL